MTTQTIRKLPDCVICAVRELTEGTPKIWTPSEAGQFVTGVLIGNGLVPNPMHIDVPYVDLWLTGTERIRVIAAAARLRTGLAEGSPVMGDRITVTYHGVKDVPPSLRTISGRTYREYSVDVARGHHS
jgi:hypothetical protein